MTKNSTGTLAKLANCYINKNFFESVKTIPNNIFNLVEVDSPNSKFFEEGSQLENYESFMRKCFKECHRVMTENSWLICWFSPEPWFNNIYTWLKETGFNTTKICGIWIKKNKQTQHSELYLSNSYEMFFYAWKGQPEINKARNNIFKYNQSSTAERPIELIKEIYNTFASPGSRILIPFLGLGNSLIAAHQLELSPIGFELNSTYRDKFLLKLEAMK